VAAAAVRDYPVWSGWIVRVMQRTCCSLPIPPWVVMVSMPMSILAKNQGVIPGFERDLVPVIARRGVEESPVTYSGFLGEESTESRPALVMNSNYCRSSSCSSEGLVTAAQNLTQYFGHDLVVGRRKV